MSLEHQGDPWVRSILPILTPPSLKDNTADVDRLVRGIRRALSDPKVRVDFGLYGLTARHLRRYDYRVSAVLFQDEEHWRLIEVGPREARGEIYGLAVDLGTSTVVIRLLHLETGQSVAEVSFLNPQVAKGEDILTRIHFASKEGGLDTLQRALVEGLNEKVRRLCERTGLSTFSLVAMSIAGNTTMTHLFLGLDPYGICREPYIPVVNQPELIQAEKIGLGLHPRAPMFVFPNAGSYFGGDLMAGILASGMAERENLCILVDVGTNAEVVIGNREWLVGCAGAAGPALEGGVADIGMMAGPGAIDKVVYEKDLGRFQVRTIENKDPVGICGSGLIDLVAELFLAGMIDLRGKFLDTKCGDRLMERNGVKHLIFIPKEDSGTGEALTLSQTDIDGLIRSKAAMYTILTTIAKTVNVSLREVECFFIGGTFGSFINPRSAIVIGMLPDLPLERYVSLGNTSLEGAAKALLSKGAREMVFRIRDRITYLELNVNQEFMNLFSAAKFIPHTDHTLFPSVPPS